MRSHYEIRGSVSHGRSTDPIGAPGYAAPTRGDLEGPIVRRDDYLQRLAAVPLFADLDRHELEAVAEVGTDVDVEENRELVRQGDPASEAFLVLDGTAVATRPRKVSRSV